MQEAGLRGVTPKRWRATTDSDHDLQVAPNVLDRNFRVREPNRVWVADITYVWTWEGWLYLAAIVDLYARRVVGWAAADHMRTELVTDALQMALRRRQPGRGLILHSDRGSQFAAREFRRLLDAAGVVPSMSRRGDCWDNAVIESFFGSIKNELLDRRPWPTRRECYSAIAEYIEVFYDVRRLHSSNGFRTPAEAERCFYAATLAA